MRVSEDARSALAARSRQRFAEARARALRAGFTEEQAPFAAVRFLIASEEGQRRVDVAEIRRGCQARYPELFPPTSTDTPSKGEPICQP